MVVQVVFVWYVVWGIVVIFKVLLLEYQVVNFVVVEIVFDDVEVVVIIVFGWLDGWLFDGDLWMYEEF